MAVQKILQYPHPILKSPSEPVRTVDVRVGRIIKNLLDTLEASPGVAIAAPQIGEARRIIVCDVSRKVKDKHHGRIILINPFIRRREGKKIVREGCLSVPDYTGNVTRYETVGVEGLDPSGRPVRFEAEGLEAQALQHEVDHLDGLLFLDRIASLSTDLFRRKTY
ncbi:MAG TPA: peptide deformylase [Nitrospiria bacterium]|nr:peptide deformylase [Nitrospiria bacterium]